MIKGAAASANAAVDAQEAWLLQEWTITSEFVVVQQA